MLLAFKFLNASLILAATPTSLLFYDIRKPNIILKDLHYEQILSQEETKEQETNEINDFDFVPLGDALIKIACCFDSGEALVQVYDVR